VVDLTCNIGENFVQAQSLLEVLSVLCRRHTCVSISAFKCIRKGSRHHRQTSKGAAVMCMHNMAVGRVVLGRAVLCYVTLRFSTVNLTTAINRTELSTIYIHLIATDWPPD
jgi:hypothetical protein